MSDELYPAVLLFGAPGVGKGTQGKILNQIPGLFHLSSGDVFRDLDPNTVAGRTSLGELVPDELTIRICRNWIQERIAQQKYNPRKDLLILDGIPRNVPQCEILEESIDVLHVIHLSTDNKDLLAERIHRRALEENRTDDAKEEVIRRRFRVYSERTLPVLNYYPDEMIHTVDPIGMPIEVLQRIIEGLIPLQQRLLGES